MRLSGPPILSLAAEFHHALVQFMGRNSVIETTLSGARRPTASEPIASIGVGIPTQASAVSWPAIIAGATGAAALSLILLILGTGLGLSSVSPWAGQGASAGAMGLSTIAWVSFTQLAAAGMGGYLAGRLRTRWARTHTDEVYFRDTAHGFLAWALATLVTAALLTSTVGAIVSGGAQAASAMAGGAAGTTAATAVAGAAKQEDWAQGQGISLMRCFAQIRAGPWAQPMRPRVVRRMTVPGRQWKPGGSLHRR